METDWVIARMRLYELLQAHPSWSVRQLAAAVGMSKTWVQKWLQRFREDSVSGLALFQSRSRAPKTRWRWHKVVIEVILALRDTLPQRYHRTVGALTILYHLHRDAYLERAGHRLPRSTRTVWKILQAAGRIPRRVREYHPIDRPQPMAEWEMDFGLSLQVGGEEGIEFLAVVDRGTSILVNTQVQIRYFAATVLLALTALFQQHGLPQRLRFDRDSRLVGSWSRRGYPSPLIRFLRCLGVEPVVCPPRRPDLKPFVERTIKTLKQECLRVDAPDSPAEAAECLTHFSWFYNHERPHQGLSCGNRPPFTAFPDRPTLPDLPEMVNPDRWLEAYHGQPFQRIVRTNGTVVIDDHFYVLGPAVLFSVLVDRPNYAKS